MPALLPRPSRPWSPCVALVGLFPLVLAAGCPAKPAQPAVVDAGAPPPARVPGDPLPNRAPNQLAPNTGAAPGPLARPPHPAMATSQYGFAALNALAATAPATTTPAPVGQGWALLAGAADHNEQEARTIFLQAFRAAADDTARAEAACGVAATLVLDPDPVGYTARLTDAYGIQLYASTARGLSPAADAARMLAMAGAGRDRDAFAAAKRLADGAPKDAWARLLEGMTRALLGDRGAALNAFAASLATGVTLPRTHLERARVALRLGDLPQAAADSATALKLARNCTPCALTHATALALDRDPKVSAQGQQELVALTGGNPPAYWTAEALGVAALLEARAGNTAAVESLGTRLKALPGFDAEAALARGLGAAALGQHEAAVVALDHAARNLVPGPLHAEALRALAHSALALGRQEQAVGAIKGLEKALGGSAASAGLLARVMAAGKQDAGAREELLRAHALDPYDPAVAQAAGRKPRPGGTAASAKAEQMWRLLGGGAPAQAMALARTLAQADPQNPYAAWAVLECQAGLDQGTELGEAADKQIVVAALDVVKRLGKTPPHEVLHGQARRQLILVLDEGDRPTVVEALGRFSADPDPALAALAREAVARGAPRPRRTAHEGAH